MARDTDYAAIAVKTAIADKFGRKADLEGLQLTAHERTISLHHGDRSAEGTRDKLLAAVRRRRFLRGTVDFVARLCRFGTASLRLRGGTNRRGALLGRWGPLHID